MHSQSHSESEPKRMEKRVNIKPQYSPLTRADAYKSLNFLAQFHAWGFNNRNNKLSNYVQGICI